MTSPNKIHIKNWDNRQTLRSDVKGPGPFIKVYKTILSNHKIAELSDADFGRLVKMWVLAAMEKDTWGPVPRNPSALQKVGMMGEEPDLKLLESIGLIEPVNGSLTGRKRVVDDPCPQGKARQGKAIPVGVGVKKKAQEVLDYWNKTHGRKISATEKIEARIRQGATAEDCRMVIDYKTKSWSGTRWQKNLQPATLFAPSHFDDYLSEAREGGVKNDNIHEY